MLDILSAIIASKVSGGSGSSGGGLPSGGKLEEWVFTLEDGTTVTKKVLVVEE